jgi:hypothetical protein
VTPEKALRELSSRRLKMVVYFFITWAYCYADCFTASIPFVLKVPK